MDKTIKRGPLFFSRKQKGWKARHLYASGFKRSSRQNTSTAYWSLFYAKATNLECFYTKHKNRIFVVFYFLFFSFPKAGRQKDRPRHPTHPLLWFGGACCEWHSMMCKTQQFWQVATENTALKIYYLLNPDLHCIILTAQRNTFQSFSNSLHCQIKKWTIFCKQTRSTSEKSKIMPICTWVKKLNSLSNVWSNTLICCVSNSHLKE